MCNQVDLVYVAFCDESNFLSRRFLLPILTGSFSIIRKEKRDWEFGIDKYILLYLKEITNKDLLYSTQNSAKYSVITSMENNF